MTKSVYQDIACHYTCIYAYICQDNREIMFYFRKSSCKDCSIFMDKGHKKNNDTVFQPIQMFRSKHKFKPVIRCYEDISIKAYPKVIFFIYKYFLIEIFIKCN